MQRAQAHCELSIIAVLLMEIDSLFGLMAFDKLKTYKVFEIFDCFVFHRMHSTMMKCNYSFLTMD